MKKLYFDTPRFRCLVDSVDLSDKEQAEKIGITRSNFYLYKSGKATPKISTLNMIAAFYGVDTLELLREVEKK